MRVGYQYRVGGVGTFYRCSQWRYMPESIFRNSSSVCWVTHFSVRGSEYTGFEYVAGKFRVRAGALADVHHGTWLHSAVTLFESDAFVEVLAGVATVEVFTTGFGANSPVPVASMVTGAETFCNIP